MNETPHNWFVLVDSQVYGPYTSDMMLSFVSEGRIVGQSVITHNRDQGFYRASAYPVFSKWQAQAGLNRPQALTQPQAQTHAGHQNTHANYSKRDAAQDVQIAVGQSHHEPSHIQHSNVQSIQTQASQPTYELQPVEQIHHDPNVSVTSVFVVMAEIQSGQAMRFLQRLQTLGPAQRIGDSVWLLRARITADALRSTLSQTLARTDRLFIVDSFRNETSWFNIGADMSDRITDLWGSED